MNSKKFQKKTQKAAAMRNPPKRKYCSTIINPIKAQVILMNC